MLMNIFFSFLDRWHLIQELEESLLTFDTLSIPLLYKYL